MKPIAVFVGRAETAAQQNIPPQGKKPYAQVKLVSYDRRDGDAKAYPAHLYCKFYGRDAGRAIDSIGENNLIQVVGSVIAKIATAGKSGKSFALLEMFVHEWSNLDNTKPTRPSQMATAAAAMRDVPDDPGEDDVPL